MFKPPKRPMSLIILGIVIWSSLIGNYGIANAQCCDNLFDFFVLSKMNGLISEATTSDAIAFARQMLPTIPALLPSLVADHVSVVQAIDTKSVAYQGNLICKTGLIAGTLNSMKEYANQQPSLFKTEEGSETILKGSSVELSMMRSAQHPEELDGDIVQSSAKAVGVYCDRPQAQVYYMNLKAATAKGAVAATQQLIGAKVGHSAVPDAIAYASDQVMAEVMNGSTPPVTATPMAAVAFFPLVPGSIVITGVTTTPSGGAPTLETFVDQYYVGTNQPSPVPVTGTYTLLGTLGSTGSYNVATGVITLTVVAGGAFGGTAASINYRYSVEDSANANAVPGMDLEVVSENVDARVFDLRINYSVFAAINLQKIHGMVLADEGIEKTLCSKAETLCNK